MSPVPTTQLRRTSLQLAILYDCRITSISSEHVQVCVGRRLEVLGFREGVSRPCLLAWRCRYKYVREPTAGSVPENFDDRMASRLAGSTVPNAGVPRKRLSITLVDL